MLKAYNINTGMQLFKLRKIKLLLLILAPLFSLAQAGKLTGKISDAGTNEPLAGVSITPKGKASGTTTIGDGTYILSLAPGTYAITFTYLGYQKKEITGVVIKAKESTFLDILMQKAAGEQLQDVVVTSSVKKESTSAVYSAQKRSAAASDGISLEAIRKTPDNNAGQVLRRVTGVSVQDNRFVVVRGLGEQYNQTMMNGVPMTSTETNRNAFAFDLIPAAVIDNITVNKTATPDMPGNFAGGVVQVNTKDFPSNDFFSIALQLGFSDGTIGKTFYNDNRAPLEFLTFPGKQRDLPEGFPQYTSKVPFTSLNLQEQFRYLRQLKNNLAPVNYGPSDLNENVQFGYGKTIKLKNQTQFGIVAALNQRKTELREEETITRDPDLLGSIPGKELRGLGNYSENIRYRYTADFGGVVNLAYRFGNNKITLKNLYTRVFSNTYTDRYKILTDVSAFTGDANYIGISHFVEQRRILNNTLAGEHRTGKGNETRLDWNVSVTSNRIYTPDTRNFILGTDSLKEIYRVSRNAELAQSLIGNSRVWSNNDDLIYAGAFNLTTPFDFLKNKQLFKSGILFQNRTRKATGSILPISNASGTIENLLAPENYYPGGAQVSVASSAFVGGSGNYNAGSSLLAGYFSLENKIGGNIRLIWGVRAEGYQQTVNIYTPVYYENFQDMELAVVKFAARTTFNFLPSINFIYSPVKSINIRAAYSNTVIRPELKDLAPYQRFDLQTFALTSGSGDLKSTSIANYDLKFEWFPSSGEIMSFSGFYKRLQNPIEYAFADLDNNLAGKYALNTGTANVRGVEAEIRKKINFIKAAPWLQHVTIFGNGALLHSKVDGKKINSTLINTFSGHPLTGQPKYIINGGTSIALFKENFEITVSYNRTGDYINELGSNDLDIRLENGNTVPRRPHYYVKPRNMMDLVITLNTLKNKGRLKLNVSNLLKDRFILYEDLNGNGKFDEPVLLKQGTAADRTENYLSGVDNAASSIVPQRTYSLSFTYTF